LLKVLWGYAKDIAFAMIVVYHCGLSFNVGYDLVLELLGVPLHIIPRYVDWTSPGNHYAVLIVHIICGVSASHVNKTVGKVSYPVYGVYRDRRDDSRAIASRFYFFDTT